MKYNYLTLLLLLVKASFCFAQQLPKSPNQISKAGKRQGEWTIWYTKDGKITHHPDSMQYYRSISYHKDKPTGLVKDYYKSGKLKWEGLLLSDRPLEVMQGKVIWYHENGAKEREQIFKKGRLVSQVHYKSDTSLLAAQRSWAELNQIGEQLYDEGEYQKALETFEKAKIQAEKEHVKDYPEYVTSLYNLALLYWTLGIYQKAEPLYEQALRISEKAIGKDHPDYGDIFNNLGIMYESMGNYQKAEPMLLESLRITEKSLGKQHADYAASLHNLANLYESMGKYEKVEPLLVEALKITEKTLGKDHPDYATTLHNLAMLYQRKGKYLEAETLFKEDMQIIEKTLGKSHPDYASSLNNLGSLYHAMGENQKAQTFFLQAIEIREKTLGKPHPHYGFSLGNLADLYKSQGEYRKAQPLLIDLNQSMLDGIDKVFPVLSEREKGQFYKTFSARFESFNSFVLLQQKHNPGIIAEMFNNQLATKACLFHATAKVRQHILESPDETLKRLYQQWLDKKNYLAKIYQLSKEEKQKQAIDENKLEEEANALEKQLSLQSELFAINTDKTRYNWQDVQKQLKASEACLEMVRFRWFNQTWTDTIYYAALLVTHVSKLPELILLENGNDLEGRYARFYENAIRKGLLAKGIGNVRVDSLYHHYWGKIAPFLKKAGVEKVYFSPDGVYNRINLNTLYNPLTGKYILDEIDIQLLTNTKDLVTRKSKANTINNASLFGYPDYNQANDKGPKGVVSTPYFSTESMKRTLKDGTLGMLKGTEREVNSIAFLLAKNQIKVDKFLEKEASEEALKNVHNPSILHIATHGFFITEAESGKGSSGATPANNTSLENPLFHSGLYLAGAQQSLDGKVKDDLSEDGILTAYEAMNLNLDQTDLVVLSACETGLGEIKNGEGVYGLQRALQTAGAKAVLMSLWKVDDTATGELMRLFYERWLQLDNKREAFKMAQLSIRARYADPYYWGAFVLVGE